MFLSHSTALLRWPLNLLYLNIAHLTNLRFKQSIECFTADGLNFVTIGAKHLRPSGNLWTLNGTERDWAWVKSGASLRIQKSSAYIRSLYNGYLFWKYFMVCADWQHFLAQIETRQALRSFCLPGLFPFYGIKVRIPCKLQSWQQSSDQSFFRLTDFVSG